MIGEGGDQLRDKGIASDVAEDLSFVAHMINLLELYDLGFSEDLKSEDLLSLLFRAGSRAYQADPCKCACFIRWSYDD